MGDIVSFNRDSVPVEQWFHNNAHRLAVAALSSGFRFSEHARPRLRYDFATRSRTTSTSFNVTLQFTLDGFVTDVRVAAEGAEGCDSQSDRRRLIADLRKDAPQPNAAIAATARAWRVYMAGDDHLLLWQAWEYFRADAESGGWVNLE